MKAAIIDQYGQPDVFRVVDLPHPEPGPNDVVVAVRASSVNPIDWKIRKGTQRAIIRYKLPWVLGLDFSGVVEAVGGNVTRFSKGDAVFGCADYKRQGTYAELLAVDQSALARKPDSMSHEEAATLPLAGLTAWQCLFGKGPLTRLERDGRPQRVFIQAGSGGVGSLAIQIAKHAQAEVTTTCSARNTAMVRELGADRVVDYTKEAFQDVVADQDFVLDALGGDARWQALDCLAPGARHVTICSDIPHHVGKYGALPGVAIAASKLVGFAVYARIKHGVRSSVVIQRPNGSQLTDLAALVESGHVRPVVDRVFSLDAIADAHIYSETGRARGKIVVAVAA